MICLDTKAVVVLLNNTAPPLRSRLAATLERGELVGVSTLVLFELWLGAAKSLWPDRNASRLDDFLAGSIETLAFDADDAREAGELRAGLGPNETAIDPVTLLVAAQARRRGAVLVTTDAVGFAVVPGLTWQNWAAG